MLSYSIRPASRKDSVEIALLATQLGYPTSEEEIRLRLTRLLAGRNNLVLVADSGEESLIGWVLAFLSQALESNCRVEIVGLIVDEKFHRQGVGRTLVRRVEQWAIEHEVAQISVRCRTSRRKAHRFYENLGYRPAKTQVVFRKQLLGP